MNKIFLFLENSEKKNGPQKVEHNGASCIIFCHHRNDTWLSTSSTKAFFSAWQLASLILGMPNPIFDPVHDFTTISHNPSNFCVGFIIQNHLRLSP